MIGVTLLALGRPYGYWAYNMAMSLRVHCPNMPIQLIHDQDAISDINTDLFDEKTAIKDEDCRTNGKINPSLAKLSLYKYIKFKFTLYLDVDGIVIRDIGELCDSFKGIDFATQIVGQAVKGQKDFPEMMWAETDQVFEKYNLPENAILPATNSSFMWIKKSRKAAKIFRDALKFYNDPIYPLKIKWGFTNAQPDELYLNASLALNGFEDVGQIGFFRTSHDPIATVDDIYKHYFIGLWGDKRMNQRLVTGNGQKTSGLYNKLTIQNGKKLFGENYRIGYHYYFLEKTKFYNG